VRVIGIEPDQSLHGLEGLKHLPSAIVPDVYDSRVEDDKIRVDTDVAYAVCHEVLQSDGLLVGHSAGAALWAAREVARTLRTGVVVALLPDGGERYLAGNSDRASERRIHSGASEGGQGDAPQRPPAR
jgi:cysteine synthase B